MLSILTDEGMPVAKALQNALGSKELHVGDKSCDVCNLKDVSADAARI